MHVSSGNYPRIFAIQSNVGCKSALYSIIVKSVSDGIYFNSKLRNITEALRFCSVMLSAKIAHLIQSRVPSVVLGTKTDSRISAFIRTPFIASKTPSSQLIKQIPVRPGDGTVRELAATSHATEAAENR